MRRLEREEGEEEEKERVGGAEVVAMAGDWGALGVGELGVGSGRKCLMKKIRKEKKREKKKEILTDICFQYRPPYLNEDLFQWVFHILRQLFLLILSLTFYFLLFSLT